MNLVLWIFDVCVYRFLRLLENRVVEFGFLCNVFFEMDFEFWLYIDVKMDFVLLEIVLLCNLESVCLIFFCVLIFRLSVFEFNLINVCLDLRVFFLWRVKLFFLNWSLIGLDGFKIRRFVLLLFL